MQIKDILTKGQRQEASDIFIIPGSRVCLKKNGEIFTITEETVMPADSEELIRQIYKIARRDIQGLLQTGDDDFSFSMQGTGRFRCSTYKQRNSLAAVIRIVAFGLPDREKMHIPEEVIELTQAKNGLILVTGPAGCGKSSTLACMIDHINQERNGHIITIEDPIEYIHSHRKSLVSQREIDHDTQSYAAALRAALRQTPNVILLGEMCDFETIQIAMTAVEMGQLLLSTLHTVGAAKTIERIVDAFPDYQKQQARIQLSMLLRAVVSQQLIPTIDGGQEPVFEIMIVNKTIQNMIREGDIYQMNHVMDGAADVGMKTMDSDILRLYREGRITKDTAVAYAVNSEDMEKKL